MAETLGAMGVLFLSYLGHHFESSGSSTYLQMALLQVPYDASWPRPGDVRHCEFCVQRKAIAPPVPSLKRSPERPLPHPWFHLVHAHCVAQGGRCAGISIESGKLFMKTPLPCGHEIDFVPSLKNGTQWGNVLGFISLATWNLNASPKELERMNVTSPTSLETTYYGNSFVLCPFLGFIAKDAGTPVAGGLKSSSAEGRYLF